MFGPNSLVKTKIIIDYCHRDKQFFIAYAKLEKLFQKKFNLTNYDILFVPGSATVGIEAVMFSTKQKKKVLGHQGKFTNKWDDLAKHYNTFKKEKGILELYCLLETSVSKSFEKSGCIVDGVSAFPYAPVPKDTKIFITCLNKQLGSLVGLAIVCVRKDFWKYMINTDNVSYLNLARYREMGLSQQTPSTAPSYVFEHAYKVINKLDIADLRKKMNRISDKIVKAIGEKHIIGEKRGPVITIKLSGIPKFLAKKYSLYGYWTKKESYQIFTYSYPENDYDKFIKDLKKNKKIIEKAECFYFK